MGGTVLATASREVVPALAERHVVRVGRAERHAVEELARSLCLAEGGRVDDPDWIAAADHAWDAVPVAVRRAIRGFRRDSGPRGAMLLRGLPVDAARLPDTPAVAGSVQRAASVPSAVLMMLAAGLGDPGAFAAEKSGALVQDVVPVPGHEKVQGNVGSTLFTLHTENAFHHHRPDHVLLLCLRADHERVAGLRVACVREVLPLLPPATRDVLRRTDFVTFAPPSFGDAGGAAEHHAVLSGAVEDPDLRVDFAATKPLTEEGAEALDVLARLLDENVRTYRLAPGELAVVDNRVAVHGRTAFRPRYDGRDRWLQRTFAFADLRRSRELRPADGAVLVS